VLKDWTMAIFAQYASGLPIQAPNAPQTTPLNNLLFRTTFANRVEGQPLFLQDLNCHCFDPNREFVLNPAAWTAPPEGNFSSSAAFYNDYRFQRRPVENLGVGRIFRFGRDGRMNLNLRVEFTNIFNRAQMPNPVANTLSTQTRNANTGQTTAGFGWVNTGSVGATTPRQGTIVGRFIF
jgi:hypothetical protein